MVEAVTKVVFEHLNVVTHIVAVPLFVSHIQRKEKQELLSLCSHVHKERQILGYPSRRNSISFHPKIPFLPVLPLPLASRRRKQTERKEKKREKFAAWIGKVIFSQEQRNNINGRENGKEEMFR